MHDIWNPWHGCVKCGENYDGSRHSAIWRGRQLECRRVCLQGGSIMHKWTNDERVMIACCNDGTKPVIFKIERIDIPENAQEQKWLEMQNFRNSADDAYIG